ncbi:HK97 family phage prohead protease [Clostridium botulinum]|nr:HK97 family phage prohead protease [Clostridium botulinum]NFI79793.1 HK97 family phage prohead protease [Clostridium botulinum]NFJ70897.1 HK97 family phage prohead protease [Clostridium botulinum]NFM10008.1 HK97 family phage prohead protease [Clostridium botulinum]NFN62951.1 HK97 family phage prohead protease [Clostridium botulinum]
MLRLEIRRLDDNTVHIEGYVNAICRDSKEIRAFGKQFVEQIRPKVFEKALKRNSDVKLLYNHRENRCLGTTKNNVELYEDAIGLHISADIKDDEVRSDADKGKLKGFSFGFNKLKDSWEQIGDGKERRYLEDIKLNEISLLSLTPAYNGTIVETRADGKESEILELRFIEDEQKEIEETRKKNNVDMSSVYDAELFLCKNL